MVFSELKSCPDCTELARSLSRAAITAWGLTYERILMIRLCSNVSSEKSKCSSPSRVFLIPSLMASNDDFFCCTKDDEFLERVRYFVMLPHTAKDSHIYLHTMITVCIDGTAYIL